jgi:lactate dehydrogenase-like 2-hydroxyacid dehydrogenase
MKHGLLVLVEQTPEHLAMIEAAGFALRLATTEQQREAILAKQDREIQAVLTNGSTGLQADMIAALPSLEIVCAQGVGYDQVDLDAARAHGIVASHGPGTNDSSVADHALALLLAAARHVPQSDAEIRRGEWSRKERPSVSGKKLGILGMGRIGQGIARRAAAGFEMQIGYASRHPHDIEHYQYFDDPIALATWCDFLVVAVPGGAATRHLVGPAVLDALGAEGFLINIARGSVVDTSALIEALAQHRIAGAALDVVEGEPNVPAALLQLDNVILTPHVAGRSPEAVEATIRLVLDNLHAHFSGQPLLTPIPR